MVMRMDAMIVFRSILKRQSYRFKEYAELTILKICEAHKDPSKHVSVILLKKIEGAIICQTGDYDLFLYCNSNNFTRLLLLVSQSGHNIIAAEFFPFAKNKKNKN